MTTYDALNETFGIVPVEEAPLPAPVPIESISAIQDTKDDYDASRNALRNMLDKGNDVLEELIEVAKSSESPRAFEVAGQLIKTISETAKDLLQLQKTMKELNRGTIEEQPQQVIKQQNNILFSGSTSDLLKQFKVNNGPIING